MKRVSILMVSVIASLVMDSAAAQAIKARPASRSMMFDMPPSWAPGPPDRNECLFNKVTKKRECHSRTEWRKIAARLEAQQSDPVQRKQ